MTKRKRLEKKMSERKNGRNIYTACYIRAGVKNITVQTESVGFIRRLFGK